MPQPHYSSSLHTFHNYKNLLALQTTDGHSQHISYLNDELLIFQLCTFGGPSRVVSPADMASSDQVMADAESPRKRASSSSNELPANKRPRTLSFRSSHTAEADATAHKAPKVPTTAEMARSGLRRSITLALEQVGFESASEEAMESFSSIVETCKMVSTCRLFL